MVQIRRLEHGDVMRKIPEGQDRAPTRDALPPRAQVEQPYLVLPPNWEVTVSHRDGTISKLKQARDGKTYLPMDVVTFAARRMVQSWVPDEPKPKTADATKP